jgi:exodeoxyribonuclease VII small subunit
MAKKKITYTDALEEIEQIIESIKNKEPNIDELSTEVKRVSELLSICKDKLYKAEKNVNDIIEGIED